MFQWNNNFSCIFSNFICIILRIINFITIIICNFFVNIIIISWNTCFIFKRFRIRRNWITWFISIIIPETSCCFSVIFTVFKSTIYCNIQIFCIINFYAINLLNAVDKWCILFKCYCFLHYLQHQQLYLVLQQYTKIA